MRKIKVLIVHYRDCVSGGGSLSVGDALANHLSECDIEAHLLFAYGGPGPISARSRVPIHYVGSKGPLDLPGWRRARSLIKSLKPDIIHFQDLVVWLFLSLTGCRTTRLLHVHGPMGLSAMRPLNRCIWRSLGSLSDGFVCISDATEKSVAELKLPNARTWVVRSAIDVNRFADLPNKSHVRQILNLPHAAKLLGTVCRLVPEKGCADALVLLSHLQEDWHLVIAGDGPLRSELVQRARELRILDRVHFLGFVDDPRLVYAAIDAFVLAIKFESFGIVIAEAMASRVPVFLLGGAGGYRESGCPLVTPNNAIVVERRNNFGWYRDEAPEVLHELAEQIRRIQANPKVRGEMIKNAGEWIAQHFSGTATANSTAMVYHAALGIGKSGRIQSALRVSAGFGRSNPVQAALRPDVSSDVQPIQDRIGDCMHRSWGMPVSARLLHTPKRNHITLACKKHVYCQTIAIYVFVFRAHMETHGHGKM